MRRLVSSVAQLAAPASSGAAAPTKPRSRLRSPPGVLFYVAVAFAVLMALWLSSNHSDLGLWATGVVWLAIVGTWAVRIAGAFADRPRFGRAERIRWLAIPAIFGIAGLVLWSNAPFDVRLSLSRSSMDRAASEVMAGVTTERQWIGFWAVDDVEPIPGGMRFIVASGDTDARWGFAYSETGGRPPMMDGWDSYEHLDGSWWVWTDGAPAGPQGDVAVP